MKICPQCGQTYDDNLNYCLTDGTVLSGDVHAAPTIAMQPPQMTAGQHQAPTVPQWQPEVSPPQARRASRTWIWVVLILGLGGVLCASGVGGAFLYTRNQTGVTVRPTATPDRSTPDATPAKPRKAGSYDLSMEKFNQLELGMKRADVERILGGKGNELSSTTGGGTRYSVNQWQGENFRSIILTFENDKITDKTQVGLDDPNLDF